MFYIFYVTGSVDYENKICDKERKPNKKPNKRSFNNVLISHTFTEFRRWRMFYSPLQDTSSSLSDTSIT